MSVYVLLILTILEFLFAMSVFRGDYLQPAVIFSLVFAIASFDLCLMKDFWKVSLSTTTLIVVSGGIFVFVIFSMFAEVLFNRFKIRKVNFIKLERKLINVDDFLCRILLVIYIVTIIIACRYVIQIARMYGGTGGVGTLIGIYNGLLKGGTMDDISYPFYIQILVDCCELCSYVWGYIIINNFSVNRKFNKMYVILFVLGIVVSLESGSRGDALSIIFSFIFMAVLIFRKTRGERRLSPKYYMYAVLIIVVSIITFQSVGTSLGRDSDLFTPFEYISIYLGAPILNLDIMIERLGGCNTSFFNYTFSGLYSSLGRIFGIHEWLNFCDPMIHLSSNGHRTGNVATTFMAYYYDAGLIGVFILTALMAILMQKMYKSCIYDRTLNVSYKTIFYTYFIFLTARSFFSNSLFNAIQLSLIKLILIIIVESRYLPKIHFKRI